MFSIKKKEGEGSFSGVIKTVIVIIIGALVMLGLNFLATNALDSKNESLKTMFDDLKSPQNNQTINTNSKAGGLYNTEKLVVDWDEIKLAYEEYKQTNNSCTDMQFDINKIIYINNDVFSKFTSEPCNELSIDNSITVMGEEGKYLINNISNSLPTINTITFSENTTEINGIIFDNNNKIKTLNIGRKIQKLNCKINITGLQRINYAGSIDSFKQVANCINMPVNVYCTDGIFKQGSKIKPFELNYEWKCDVSENKDSKLYAYCVKDTSTQNYMVHIYGKGEISTTKSFTIKNKDGSKTTVSDYPWKDNVISLWDSDTYKITKIKIHNGPSKIPNTLFSNSSHVSDISLPISIKFLESDVFASCQSLESINIPENVSEIKSNTFNGSLLKEITVNEYNEFFTSKNGILFSSDMKVLYRVPPKFTGNNNFYKIPSAVETISAYAFGENKEILRIKIPDSVTVIEEKAFEGSLLSEDVPEYKNNDDFIIDDWLISVHENEDESYFLPNYNKTVTGPTVEHIAQGAFTKCNSLKYIYLTKTLKKPLDIKAFNHARYLEAIYYNGTTTGLTSILDGLSIVEASRQLNGITFYTEDK